MVVFKLNFNNDIRRISTSVSSFKELEELAKGVYQVQHNFIFKYKDEEGDLISCSSDMEFREALSTSPTCIKFQLFMAEATEEELAQESSPVENKPQPKPQPQSVHPVKEFINQIGKNFVQNVQVKSDRGGHDTLVELDIPLNNLNRRLLTSPLAGALLGLKETEVTNQGKEVTLKGTIDMPFSMRKFNPSEHKAWCDSCEQPIHSVRYKCANCADFDLCEKCENKQGVHNENHVFLKFKKPMTVECPHEKPIVPFYFYKEEEQRLKEELRKKAEEEQRKRKEKEEIERRAAQEKKRKELEFLLAQEQRRLREQEAQRKKAEQEQRKRREEELKRLQQQEKDPLAQSLEVLENMGFTNRHYNRQTLLRFDKNLQQAIEHLLQN